jgi:hypothetical protein
MLPVKQAVKNNYDPYKTGIYLFLYKEYNDYERSNFNYEYDTKSCY